MSISPSVSNAGLNKSKNLNVLATLGLRLGCIGAIELCYLLEDELAPKMEYLYDLRYDKLPCL